MYTKNCRKEFRCKDTLLRFRDKRFGSCFLQNDTQNTHYLLVDLCSSEQNVHKQVLYCAMCLLESSALQCLHIGCLQWERATARVRRPNGLRPPSDQIAFAVRSDCVRRPIELRSPSDRIAFAIRSDYACLQEERVQILSVSFSHNNMFLCELLTINR